MQKIASTTPSAPESKGWFARWKLGRSQLAQEVQAVEKINQGDEIAFGLSGTTITTMLSSTRREIRDRRVIYTKWADMAADPIVSTALGLLVTAALGGHETTGDVVFIEPHARIKGDAAREKLVAEIAGDLTEIFNAVAQPVALTGAWAGDAYARLYGAKGKGITDVHLDENWLPPMVQPYEQGGRTVGYSVYTGARNWERLNVLQMARMKMPRSQFVPQHAVIEKALRMNVLADRIEDTPLLPSFAGGSLLHAAEKPYEDLYATLVGLVGQRLTDSISEENIGVMLNDMSPDQQKRFFSSVETMFKASKERALKAVKTGVPVLEKVKNLLPVFNEKQLVNLGGPGSNARATPVSIEDVLFHARLLSGSLGVDLSNIGFADQMAGGLGEGGWFRTSAHMAERARVIRAAQTGFFNHIIDVHTILKYGVKFDDKDRPWQMNYYGSISALEAERQTTRTNAMNGGLILVQAMEGLKNLGTPVNIAEEFLTKTMQLDADQAKLYAQLMETKRPADAMGGEGGGF